MKQIVSPTIYISKSLGFVFRYIACKFCGIFYPLLTNRVLRGILTGILSPPRGRQGADGLKSSAILLNFHCISSEFSSYLQCVSNVFSVYFQRISNLFSLFFSSVFLSVFQQYFLRQRFILLPD